MTSKLSMVAALGCLVYLMTLPASGRAAAVGDQPAAGVGGAPSYWFRILLPGALVPSQVGHASFRSGANDVMVFAADLPVDDAALQQITGTQAATVRHFSNATVLAIPLPASEQVDAVPAEQSFHIVLTKPNQPAITGVSYVNGRIMFPSTDPGQVVSVTDTDAGTPLLVGTVLVHGGLDFRLQGPGYKTIPAVSGVVVEARSDGLTLQPDAHGFALASSDQPAGLPVGYPPVSNVLGAAPHQSLGMRLPHGTFIALHHRMETLQRRVAVAPALGRREPSLRLARVLLALGLGPEAHGVLTDLLRSDPSAIDDSRRRDLLAIANIISGRPADATAAWPKTSADWPDEPLWHGLAKAETGDSDAGAQLIAPHVDGLIALPHLLRSAVAPLAAETLIRSGDESAAQSLLAALTDEPALTVARAELLEAEHHPHAALAAYTKMLGSTDQRRAGIARYRSIMLQEQLHQIDPHAAAAALGRHVYEWRSPRHELNVRLAIARLQADAGQWPQVFAGLRQAMHLFPDQAQGINRTRKLLFDRLTASAALKQLPPLAVVSILKQNLDEIPPGSAGLPLLRLLYHRLLALGLPDQAAAVLQQVAARAPDDEGKARAGLALAQIDLNADHPVRAGRALAASDAADLSQGLQAARALLASKISAKRGAPDGIVTLVQANNPQALQVATDAAAKHHDWQALEQADQKLAGLTVPSTGSIDQKAAKTLLQWAVAAAHRQDVSTLSQLRTAYLSRLPPGRTADLFTTITASPLPARTGLSAALAQIAAIERVGSQVGTPAGAAPH